MSEETPITPERFFETVSAYQKTAALKAGIELDLFTAIADGATTAADIAQKVQGAERGVRILCDYLTIQGVLTKASGRYGLTREAAAFLNRKSPTYMGGTVRFILSPALVRNFDHLAETIRSGHIREESNTVSDNNALWVDFARAMAPTMIPGALAIADLIDLPDDTASKVLDIASGHGTFGITVARRYARAVIDAVDWPAVLEVAAENARTQGVADRFHKKPGDAFTIDFGHGYDVALVTNFLHHFDRQTCTQFLQKVAGALKSGGRVAILEFVPNEDRVSPPQPAAFALNMLAGTDRGDAYTLKELSVMLGDAGFGDVITRTLPTPHTVIVATKRR